MIAFKQGKDFAFHQQGVWFPIFKTDIKKNQNLFVIKYLSEEHGSALCKNNDQEQIQLLKFA